MSPDRKTPPRSRSGQVAAILSAVSLTCLAGCAVGPDFHRPPAPAVDGYTAGPLAPETVKTDVIGGDAQHFAPGQDIPGQWWTLFHSEQLNAVIAQALKANPDLQSAHAALRAALENVYAQEGAYFPSISANFTPSRQHNAVQPSPTLATFVSHFDLYSAQVAGTWALDIWGGNRRAVEALKAQADAQRFQLEAAYLTLTAGIATAAVQEASLRGQIAATEDIIKSETEALDILRKQCDLGQVAAADVVAQEAALTQAQATLPPLKKQLLQQRDLLTALAGRLPSQQIAETFDLASLQLPGELPVSLPSKLIEQRPDIRTARENLHAASAQIGIAIANMLPDITINGNYGTTATQVDQLFKPLNGYWSIAGGVTQPIFQGGALLHKTRAARATFEQAAAQYRSTVNTAFQNVADTLGAIQTDADSLKTAVATEQTAREGLKITRHKLDLGAVDYLALLTAQQAYQQAVINRVQAQAQRYTDTIALFQALGGGWWNRTTVNVGADPGAPTG
ncbi:MAG: efflux transporter outer membrane subunit [Rhodospirillaceae bacterium]|nr:MAG: efflux transporter outer membrane subunit [Rhodospirillaceae bacterium]